VKDSSEPLSCPFFPELGNALPVVSSVSRTLVKSRLVSMLLASNPLPMSWCFVFALPRPRRRSNDLDWDRYGRLFLIV
jgi:hypothetical protein